MEKHIISDFEEELKESYLKFALSVIISRAIPDARDGLKPVQRRILYAMYDMGLLPNKPFRKSATVVGEVIGKYHPHGDQAVYDALVRLTQDFNMRYPLVEGQGNFGSIDGDPPAAYRYCLTSDSIVITNKGLKSLGKIASSENIKNIGLEVLSFNKKRNKVSKWFDSGIHPVFEIKTLRGYSLKGTLNHPVLIYNKFKKNFMWKTINSIQLGDYAVIDISSEVLWQKGELETSTKYLKNVFSKKGILITDFENPKIILSSKNSNLLKKLQVLLLRLGIISYIRKNSLIISLFGSLENFSKFVGFDDRYMNEKLIKTLKSYKGKVFEIKSGYLIDVIVSKRFVGFDNVYSIKVESDCHSFVANGFINHNTEARLEKISLELLDNIEENVVDFVNNFDGRFKEPVLLPAKFPNLLVNGAVGIAVGMGTSIPPHNLSEIIDGTIALIDNPNITISDLMKYIKGPDFPTGGVIVNEKGIYEAYKTGRGKIVVRAKYELDHKNNIIIKEIPYLVNKAELISKIAQLVRDGIIDGIADIRDESDKDGLRIVIEVKRGYESQIVINQLLKHTKLQDTFSVNMIAILNNQPRMFNLKELLEVFVNFRKEVIIRRTKFRLNKAKVRMHVLEGFLKALNNLEEIIKIIRNSEDVQIARKILIDKYEFTQEQVNAILELKLQSLTKLEREKILNEYRELEKEISYYQTLLTREDEILNLIKKELQEIKTKYSDKRRTLISKEESEISFDIEDLIQKEETVILITRSGYVKRMSLKSFKSQNRNTKGKTSVKTYEDDMPYEITVCNTHSQLFFITNRARIFWLKAYKIPEMSLTSRGKSITQFFELNQDEKIISILENKNANYIVIITKNGKIKRVILSEILKGRMGSQIMKLKEDDEVVKCILTLGEEDILIAKEDGKVVRIKQSEIPIQSRKSSGVQGVRGKDVISGCIILPSSKVITITQYGYGKKVKEEEIPVLRRGAKGIYIIKAKEKIGNLIEVIDSIQENEDLLITTRRGISLRIDISKLPELSRNAIGVKLIDLQDDDFVSAVSIVR